MDEQREKKRQDNNQSNNIDEKWWTSLGEKDMYKAQKRKRPINKPAK